MDVTHLRQDRLTIRYQCSYAIGTGRQVVRAEYSPHMIKLIPRYRVQFHVELFNVFRQVRRVLSVEAVMTIEECQKMRKDLQSVGVMVSTKVCRHGYRHGDKKRL